MTPERHFLKTHKNISESSEELGNRSERTGVGPEKVTSQRPRERSPQEGDVNRLEALEGVEHDNWKVSMELTIAIHS